MIMPLCEREAGKTLISLFSFRDATKIKQEQEKHCSAKAKKRDHSASERWAGGESMAAFEEAASAVILCRRIK